MSDLMIPDDWLCITEKGRQAIERNALDELDEALIKIDAHLVEIRRGAWSALFPSILTRSGRLPTPAAS